MPAVFDIPLNTNDLSIDRVLGAGLPVLLVFLEGQAAPSMTEMLDRLAREFAGQLLLAKINVKDSPASARRYEINRTPAIVVLTKGQVLSKGEGISVSDLSKYARYLLGKGPKPEVAPSPSYSQPYSRQAGNGSRSSQAASASTGFSQSSQLVIVTDQTFQRDVIGSPIPVLVDFWAPWCGPCRMTEPTVEKLARELQGRLKVAKINVDENPRLSQQYGIQSIPTMMVIKNGKIADRWMGALPEPALRGKVMRLI